MKLILTLTALIGIAITVGLAIAGFGQVAVNPELPNTVTVYQQLEPNGFTFTWHVRGWVVGKCSLAVGNTAPTWFAQPPPNSTCKTSWYFDIGPLISNGPDCQQAFSSWWKVYMREDAPNAQWFEIIKFKWSDFDAACCSHFPPQNCSANYDIGPIGCSDGCGPNR